MKNTIWNFTGFFALLILAAAPSAEELKNYSDCDVCPGNIYYNPQETEKILGLSSTTMISALFDENRYNREIEKSISVSSSSGVTYITHAEDQSYIQVFFGGPENRIFEIYLQSDHHGDNRIDLKETMEEAWKKFRKSKIYHWASARTKAEKWEEILGSAVIYAVTQLKAPETKE